MKKKLRIAIVCDSIDDTIGGGTISARRFAKGLAEKGNHVVIITTKFVNKAKKIAFEYAKVYEFPSLFTIGAQKVACGIARKSTLENIFNNEKVNIVYCIYPSLLSLQSRRAAAKLRIPSVSHSHVQPGNYLFYIPKLLKIIINEKIIYKILTRFYTRFDGIIFPTEFARKQLDIYNILNRKIVISNGVNEKIFYPTSNQSANFEILFVGRLDPEKNVGFLIDALYLLKIQNKLSKNIHCTIVGNGIQKDLIKSKIESYDLEDVVTLAGRISDDTLIKYYHQCSVFVLPSLYELEGMVVLEAMACGKPILIANSNESAARFFVDQNGYIFDVKDPKDLAEKLIFLTSNTKILEQMGQKSIKLSKDYIFSDSVNKLENFLQSFIN